MSATLSAALHAAAARGTGITYLERDTGEPLRLSYADILHRASRVLGELQRRGIKPGTHVVFQLEDNPQMVDAFWACQLGGLVPVPLNASSADEHLLKAFRVLGQIDGAQLVTQGRIPERLWEFARRQGIYDDFKPVFDRAIDVEQIAAEGPQGEVFEPVPDEVASIQYSSGSTGSPKGVLLTHANLLSDIQAMAEHTGMVPDDRFLSWVPLTHDLGMVMFHLLPVVLGADQLLISAMRFARRPRVWLDLAEQYAATVLCSPNFGYQHYLKAYAKAPPEALDLSGVRMIINGGEPISKALCDRFSATLAPHGLSPTAMRPAYGMAETSAAITFSVPGAPVTATAIRRSALAVGAAVEYLSATDPDRAEVVCVGSLVDNADVAVLDDAGQPLQEDHYGRIHARGPMVAGGYYGQAPRHDGWLDTGDLGYLHAGELYVIGRAKDVIIVHGVNYHPADLERICCEALGLETGRLACGGVDVPGEAREQVVMFVVFRQPVAEMVPVVRGIRRVLSEQAQLEVDAVVPVRALPKTTSGKVQRYKLADAYRAGEFAAVLEELETLLTADTGVAFADGLEQKLYTIFNAVVPDMHIAPSDNIVEAGVSSLSLAEVLEALDAEFPEVLELSDFLEYPTIEALAAYLSERLVADQP